MQIISNKFVIDTDCLNFLLNSYIGKEILYFIELLLPHSILNELGQKERKDLKKMNYRIVELGRDDRNYAGNIIWKIYQDKEYKISYLKNRKIHHTGEAEGAAIARKEKCNLVIKERRTSSIIKKMFQHSIIPILNLIQFGKYVLESNGLAEQVKNYTDEVYKEYS